MQRVLVIDKNKQPLMPCAPARARELLNTGRAAVYRRFPFTIILKVREGGTTQPIALKFDPGSHTTGMALVVQMQGGQRVVWAAELTHRSLQIKKTLLSRHYVRSSRRQRKTRYRPARFLNRRHTGWLPPSLISRIDNNVLWTNKLAQFCPITSISMELAKFDTQAMQNPEISGVEYQQGELIGYEVREYLLEKWGRACAYCHIENVPMEIEHIIPKSRGGSHRVSNLCLACHDCNQRKGSSTATEFGYPHIQAKVKKPLKDAAAVNASRWKLWDRLKQIGLPIEVSTGGRTKFNRVSQGYAKEHWLDAVCVGVSGEKVYIAPSHRPLLIAATGRGSRQMCRVDKYGFPRTSAKAKKRVHGFQTGDMVKAIVTSGKKVGTYIGRVSIRSSGQFNVTTPTGTVQGINYHSCSILQHSDGYTYLKG